MKNKTNLKKLLNVLTTPEDRRRESFKTFDTEAGNLKDKLRSETLVSILFEEVIKDLDILRSSLTKTLDEKISSSSQELYLQIETKINEIKKIFEAEDFAKPEDILNLSFEIDSLRTELENLPTPEIITPQQVDEKIQQTFSPFEEDLNKTKERIASTDENLRKNLESLKNEMLTRISSTGGGSMNRQIRVEGVDVLTKYTDINIYGVTSSVISSVDATRKWVNIGIPAGTGGGGGGGISSVLSGTGILVDNTTPSTPIVSLGNTSVVTGTYGSATSVGQFTVNQQGRITAASVVGISSPPLTRAINTTAPLSGGGDLSADRTLTTSMNTNKLIGRGSASTGVMEEITLGTNLSLSGTTLNATGGSGTPGGSDTQVQFNDSSSFGGDAGLVFNKTSNLLTINSGDFKITAPTAANFFNVNVTNSVATIEYFQSGVKDHLITLTNNMVSINSFVTITNTLTVGGLINNSVLISVPVGQSTNNSLAGICELWGDTGNPTFVQFNEKGVANRGSFGFAGGSSTLSYRSAATTMSDGTQRWSIDNSGNESLNGKLTNYSSVNTAGWGVPAIYGSGRSAAQSAAVATVATYTVGAADGSFIITSNVNVTTSTAHSFTVTCAYTDETNTSRTLTLSYIQIGGGTPIATITNVTGAGPYEGVPNHIRCKASTAITIATTGTFTTVTYNVEAAIIQIT